MMGSININQIPHKFITDYFYAHLKLEAACHIHYLSIISSALMMQIVRVHPTTMIRAVTNSSAINHGLMTQTCRGRSNFMREHDPIQLVDTQS
jgi:hypothetical protein